MMMSEMSQVGAGLGLHEHSMHVMHSMAQHAEHAQHGCPAARSPDAFKVPSAENECALLHTRFLLRPVLAVRVHGNLCRLGLLPVSAPGTDCMLLAGANTADQACSILAGRTLSH